MRTTRVGATMIALAIGSAGGYAAAASEARSPPPPSAATAAAAARPAAAPAAAAPATPPATASAVDLKRGERLFLQCRACHALGTDAEGKIGPPLGGMMDSRAGAVAGFNYTKALADSGLTWDEATLDRWLAQPSAVVPGTSMIYAGLAEPEDRRQLLAFLKHATALR